MASAVGVVGMRAAAHLLAEEKGVREETLVWAASQGQSDPTACARAFPGCPNRRDKGGIERIEEE